MDSHKFFMHILMSLYSTLSLEIFVVKKFFLVDGSYEN